MTAVYTPNKDSPINVSCRVCYGCPVLFLSYDHGKHETLEAVRTALISYLLYFCQRWIRLRLKCDGTRAETRFRLSTNQTSHLNRRGRQFSRLLAAEVCASAVVMLDTPCSEVVCEEYWLPTPFSSFPFTSPPGLSRVPSHFN
jgi:hypothetical protein